MRHIRSVVVQHSLTEAVDKGMRKVGAGFNFDKDYRYTTHPRTKYRKLPGCGFFYEEKTVRLGRDYDIMKIKRMDERAVPEKCLP